MDFYQISDDQIVAIKDGARNIELIKKLRFKSVEAWIKSGAKENVLIVQTGETPNSNGRMNMSKVVVALPRNGLNVSLNGGNPIGYCRDSSGL